MKICEHENTYIFFGLSNCIRAHCVSVRLTIKNCSDWKKKKTETSQRNTSQFKLGEHVSTPMLISSNVSHNVKPWIQCFIHHRCGDGMADESGFLSPSLSHAFVLYLFCTSVMNKIILYRRKECRTHIWLCSPPCDSLAFSLLRTGENRWTGHAFDQ